MIIKSKIKGLIVPTFTPLDSRGELKLEMIDRYARYLVSIGVDGVFICGTTGEGLLLSVEERQKILEAWMLHSNNLTVIVHISSTSYKDSIRLASHAKTIGVDAIACMGPCYFPPNGVSELVEFNKRIAYSAPEIPYYYYHIPSVSRVDLPMVQFLSKVEDEIPNFCGIKFTSKNLVDFQECIRLENYKFDILNGNDEYFLNGMLYGVEGSIGTSFNFIPQLYLDIKEAFENNDIKGALDYQARAIDFVKLMLKYENAIVSSKAIFKIMGLDLGPCRLPLRNLTDVENRSLEADLKVLGFFNSISTC
ncbi:dihydrodipicolinate synthase family protein [Membranihabitans maritimus]|uniref:dihydrodipicolinate synthase family protein n=1 Tax=Membranihabitans maritimus TaxID=2904244 RepID=UPI001F0115F9|nr:dihydrodipicolinate synthase family protein [Membranihabitans maritimus]